VLSRICCFLLGRSGSKCNEARVRSLCEGSEEKLPMLRIHLTHAEVNRLCRELVARCQDSNELRSHGFSILPCRNYAVGAHSFKLPCNCTKKKHHDILLSTEPKAKVAQQSAKQDKRSDRLLAA